MKPGPKSTYTPELGERIAAEIADGTTLAAVAAIEGMPSARTIKGWAISNAEFRTLYNQARAMAGDRVFDDLRELAARSQDIVREAQEAGINPQAAATAHRNEIHALMWIVSRLISNRYAERVHTSHEITAPGDLVITAQKAAHMLAVIARTAAVPGPLHHQQKPAGTIIDLMAEDNVVALPRYAMSDDRIAKALAGLPKELLPLIPSQDHTNPRELCTWLLAAHRISGLCDPAQHRKRN